MAKLVCLSLLMMMIESLVQHEQEALVADCQLGDTTMVKESSKEEEKEEERAKANASPTKSNASARSSRSWWQPAIFANT